MQSLPNEIFQIICSMLNNFELVRCMRTSSQNYHLFNPILQTRKERYKQIIDNIMEELLDVKSYKLLKLEAIDKNRKFIVGYNPHMIFGYDDKFVVEEYYKVPCLAIEKLGWSQKGKPISMKYYSNKQNLIDLLLDLFMAEYITGKYQIKNEK